MPLNIHSTSMPFKKWSGASREHKLLLIFSTVIILLYFYWFKSLYPFPNFLPDSYSYLEAAQNNQAINMWPIGYSKFLRFFSSFTNSHLALVLFQYLCLQASVIYFLFTLSHLLVPGKWVMRLLVCLNIVNPLLLYVSNLVSSDALFAALSMVWLTQLIWILHSPGMRLLVVHSLVLLLVFTIRYNALYYPFISAGVIMVMPRNNRSKIIAIATIVMLIGAFVRLTQYQYKTRTGIGQFSAFGGWQLASNALFAYAHVSQESTGTIPAQFRNLHSIVNRHMDSLRHVKIRPDASLGIYYLWDERAPLKKYLSARYHDNSDNGFKLWASLGPLYYDYGAYLIRYYPWTFTRYYLWPNVVNYYVPDSEFLGSYNMGKDTIDPIAVSWFGLKTNRVHFSTMGEGINIPDFLPLSSAIVNILFVLSFAGISFLGGFKRCSRLFKHVAGWVLLVWSCNLGFSVLASPVVLRYQVFPLIVMFSFMVIILSVIVRESMSPKTKDPGNLNHEIVKGTLISISN